MSSACTFLLHLPSLSWKAVLCGGGRRPLIKTRGPSRTPGGGQNASARATFTQTISPPPAHDLIELAVTVTMSIDVPQDPLTQRGAVGPSNLERLQYKRPFQWQHVRMSG